MIIRARQRSRGIKSTTSTIVHEFDVVPVKNGGDSLFSSTNNCGVALCLSGI